MAGVAVRGVGGGWRIEAERAQAAGAVAARVAGGRAAGAVASALTMRSGLGTGPWDTFFAATHASAGVSYGALSAVAALGLAVLAWAHGRRPHATMLANAVAGGLLVERVLPHVPAAPSAAAGCAYAALALALGVLSGVLVFGTRHARTAYDGALVAVCERRRWGVARARLCLDVPVLAAGWALGGRVGAGTLAGALLTGPLVQAALGARAPGPGVRGRPAAPVTLARLTPFEPARAVA